MRAKFAAACFEDSRQFHDGNRDLGGQTAGDSFLVDEIPQPLVGRDRFSILDQFERRPTRGSPASCRYATSGSLPAIPAITRKLSPTAERTGASATDHFQMNQRTDVAQAHRGCKRIGASIIASGRQIV